MRQYRIGPVRDRLGGFLAVVDRLVERRLAAKARARRLRRRARPSALAGGGVGRDEAGGQLRVRLPGRGGPDAVRRRPRRQRGHPARAASCSSSCAASWPRAACTLLEADTDGVYFAVPETLDEADERRVVAEVAALLPPLVHLEFEGRYAAMLSHEPKNYAL